MPRPVPTTLRLRSSRSSPRGQPVPHVPNRPLRFPRSTPPPEPSARPSGFSVRSQRDSLGLNPQMINGSRSYPRCREVQSRRATHSLSQPPPVCQNRVGGVATPPLTPRGVPLMAPRGFSQRVIRVESVPFPRTTCCSWLPPPAEIPTFDTTPCGSWRVATPSIRAIPTS